MGTVTNTTNEIESSDRLQSHGMPPGLRFGLIQGWHFIFRPKQNYTRLQRQFGDFVTLYGTPAGDLVLALTPEAARQVLSANPDEYGAVHRESFTDLVGPGSFLVLEGAEHRAERKLLMPAFHPKNLNDFGREVREITRTHTDGWRPGHQFRAYDVMLDISRDVILRVVFGIADGPYLAEGRTVVSNILKSLNPLIALTPAFRKWWFPPWRKFQRIKCSSADFLSRYMAERRAEGKESSDVLGILMAARHEDGTSPRDDVILGKLGTIVMAGHKNSAAALAWALYELAHAPSALTRLREELDALGTDPDPETIARQPYLGAVCDEILRLHTTHTEVARMCQVPLNLSDYIVPKGASVGVGICAIHQDSTIYPEPGEFRPERFLGKTFSPFEYLPYGGGHRRCIGASLAAFEIRIALAAIVTRWELESLNTERDARKNIVMGPRWGVPMRVTARR